MATTYTRKDFTPAVLPNWMKKDIGILVSTAVAMGWKFMIKSGNTATLIAPPPNERIKIHLSGRRKSGPVQGLFAKVEKYGNPLLVPKVGAEKEFTDRMFTEFDRVVEKQVEEAIQQVEQTIESFIHETPEAPMPDVTKTLTLVSEGPMISKSGTGTGYASDIATQREWSDGSITYHCTRCDMEGPAPRSMASHWRKHVNEDERNRGDHFGVTVTLETSGYTPTEERLASLADRIAAAIAEGIDWNNLGEASKHLAYVALAWENARHTRGESGLREPLTDTELLNKIRGLVDNGLYQSQQEQIAALAQECATLRAQTEEATARYEKLRQNAATVALILNVEAS